MGKHKGRKQGKVVDGTFFENDVTSRLSNTEKIKILCIFRRAPLVVLKAAKFEFSRANRLAIGAAVSNLSVGV